MPPGKDRDLEDTWKPEELQRSLKGTKDRSKHRDKDGERRKEKHRDDGDDKKRRKRREEDDVDRKERRHHDKENKDKDKERRRRHHEDQDDDERRKRKEERRKPRDEDGDDKEKKHRKHKDDGEDKERRHRKHREDEGDEERRKRKEEKRRHRDEGDDSQDRRRHRRDEDGERRHRKEENGERRHHRDGSERRHRREEGERKHRRHGEEDRDKRLRRQKEEDNDDDVRNHRRRRHHRDDDDDDDGSHHRRRHHRDREEDEDEDTKKSKSREKGEKERKRPDESDESEKRRKEEGKPSSMSIKKEEESDEEEKPAVNGTAAEDDEYNYDDDFEDYEDDFEDEEDNEGDDKDDDGTEDDEPPPRKPATELDEIMDAMNKENDRLLSASKRNQWAESPDSYEEDTRRSRPKTSGSRTFINFVSAKQRAISDKVMGKARRRGQELQKLIELDVAGYDIFDMPPVKEYDMYMRSYGRSNAKQAYVQTNEDNLEREVQTEEIEYTEKWCQHPPEELKACGGTDGKDADEETRLLGKPTDSVKLSKFIQRAGQAVLILLEEELAERNQGDQHRQQSNICVSESFSSLGKLRFLKGRCVIHSQFSPVQNNLLLTVYSSSEKERDSVDRLGIVCLWNVNEPSMPQKILVCESQPTCCCFSPTKASLAFAGMRDGSVVVWDLREPPSMHKPFRTKDQDFRLCFPTYNTAGVLDEEAHKSAVTSLVPIVSAGDSAVASLEEGKGDDGEGLSFQLASMEELSVLNLWVVAEISNPDTAGSQSDLGLAPGGRIKLIKSTTVILDNPLRDLRVKTSLKSFEMQVNPKSVGHFYVGTDSGSVVHCVRYGAKVTPRAHRPYIDSLVDVTSIDFSPFSEPCFLVGCSDGSVRLHSVDRELPLLSWPQATDGQPVTCIRWCRSRPSIFFVLDSQSRLYIWDLLMSDAVAMKEERIADQRVTSLCLSNDHSATGQGIPGRPPVMGVCLENGAVELHSVSREFSALMPDEIDQFAEFLQSVM